MKVIIYILFIITIISSNKVFSQEENSIYYITDLRGDISLEMEINNLQSNNGPLYIRILDENENQKMDFSLIGIPKEKFGSSNNVKPILGPPKFEKMLFSLTENKKVIMIPVN
jgi:uncharacterized protein (DUF2141 family)